MGFYSVMLGLILLTTACKKPNNSQDLAQTITAQQLYEQGGRYYLGKGVKQNYTKALELYQQAANRGLAVAQSDLGTMYYNGLGIPSDKSKAVFGLKKPQIKITMQLYIT